MKPTTLELNKKLAEYEGGIYQKGCFRIDEGFCEDGHYEYMYFESIKKRIPIKDLRYTESLDAQIPIIIKLGLESGGFAINDNKFRCNYYIWVNMNSDDCIDYEGFGDTYPQASAYALYYAIERSEDK